MKRSALCIALIAGLTAAAAIGQPLPEFEDPRGDRMEYEIEFATEVSDNRARTDPDSDSGVDLVPRAMVWIFHHGSRFEARAIGLLEYYNRIDSDFGNDLQLRLAAVADWAIMPHRLYWTFQDFADVQPVDLLGPDTPENRQQVNTFVTGPTLLVSPGGVWSGELEGRYVRTDAEESGNFDSDRVSAAARLIFAPRPSRSFALGVEASEVDHRDDTPLTGDWDRVDASLRFRNYLRRLGLELTAGHSEIDFDNGERLSGPLLRAWLRWAFNDDNLLIARIAREFSDAARDMVYGAEPFTMLREDRGRPEPRAELYRARRAELEWSSSGRRSGWSVAAYARDYDYPFEVEPLSHEAGGAIGRIEYRLNASHRLRGELGYERRDYDTTDRIDRDAVLGVTYERDLNSRWSVRAGLQRYDRNSSGTLETSYTENRLLLALVLKGGR